MQSLQQVLDEMIDDIRQAAVRRSNVWIASEEDERKAQAFIEAHRPQPTQASTNEKGN